MLALQGYLEDFVFFFFGGGEEWKMQVQWASFKNFFGFIFWGESGQYFFRGGFPPKNGFQETLH